MNKKFLVLTGVLIIIVAATVLFMSQRALAPDEDISEEEVEEMEEADDQDFSTPPTEETDPAEENPSDEPDEEEPAPQTLSVTYSATGFSPSVVNVEAGGTVVFQNTTSNCMWVASDPHPTHTVLPGFDSGACLQSYQFTFTQTGSWSYHNHFRESHRGTIVVE